MEHEKILEAILFAAGEAVPLASLADAIGADRRTTEQLLRRLSDSYEASKRGIQIIEINNSFQMTTNPLYYQYIQALVQNPREKTLSRTLLETLAIIAYKQPVTKGQIEEIRGVSADHSVNRLLEYGLIVEKGRLDAPGRPILFGTSDEFLRHFGFRNTDQLPPFGDVH